MKIEWKSFIVGIILGMSVILLLNNRYTVTYANKNNRVLSLKLDNWTGKTWIYNPSHQTWVPETAYTDGLMENEAKRLQRIQQVNSEGK